MKKLEVKVQCDTHALRYAVPSPVWRQGPYIWTPRPIDNLSAEIQYESVGNWNRNPSGPQTFVVTSHDTLKAEFFAAMLVQEHMRQNRHSDVVWQPIYDSPLDRYTSEFRPAIPLKKQEQMNPSLLVLTNLGLESTDVQVEAARDLMARWPSVPVILVGTGLHIVPREFANYMLMAMHRAAHIDINRELRDV